MTRIKNLYDPKSLEPYRISRSKIEDFMKCPRCFYLDRRLGVSQPPSFPFNLNSAVDRLLKKEFDHYRSKGQPHPLMTQHGISGVPLQHDKLEEWREPLRGGITYQFSNSNLLLCGGVDDLWISESGEWIVVDYKATSKDGDVSLDADWQISYKRQMEIYQWLFKKNGFPVSDIGYFVYCNGDASLDFFNAELKFKISVIPYHGNSDWVENSISALLNCLRSDALPAAHDSCKFCSYRNSASNLEKKY